MTSINVGEGDGVTLGVAEAPTSPVIQPVNLLWSRPGLNRLEARRPYRGSLWIGLSSTDGQKIARSLEQDQSRFDYGVYLDREIDRKASLVIVWKQPPHVHTTLVTRNQYTGWLVGVVLSMRLWNRGYADQPAKGYSSKHLYEAWQAGNLQASFDSTL